MNLRKQAAKGVLWSFIQRWGSHVISFSVFLLLARLLGPKDFGLVAMAGIFIAFMKVFLDQGFATAIVQRENLEPEHLDTAFWAGLLISIGLIGLSLLTAPAIADFYDEPQLAGVIGWLSLGFLFKALNSVQTAILTRKFAFKTLAVRSIIAMVIGGTVGITMALTGQGVWSLVGNQLAMGLAEVVVLWSVSDWRPGWQFSRQHLQELLSYGLNVTGLNGLNFLNRYSDNLLVSTFLGPTALGYYTVAYRVLTVLTELISKTTTQVAFPAFSRLQEDPDRLRRAFYKATQFTSLISLPAFLGIAALSPEIVQTLFGDQWHASAPVMRILTMAGILQTVTHFNGPVIMAMGKPGWHLGIKSVNTVVNVVGFIVVVPWGIVAVAAAYVIRAYVLSPLDLWVLRRLIGLRWPAYLSQVAAPLAAAVTMVAAVLGTKALLGAGLDGRALLAICIAVGAIVYTTALLAIAPKLFRQVLDLATLAVPARLGGKR